MDTLGSQYLFSLLTMVQAIGSSRKRRDVLATVTRELARVMEVDGISVKLLRQDGHTLEYAASFGLPKDLTSSRLIDVRSSRINSRILEGEPYVTGRVSQRDLFQFHEDLASAEIDSVLFVPLKLEAKVIGILGAYCRREECFCSRDVDFFQLAAGLVAIAIDNAMAYEAIEQLNEDRSKFMRRAAHNLRAPLAAMLSILETVREGYHGPLTESQSEYLRRVDRRARTMIAMVNELLVLAKHQGQREARKYAVVDFKTMSGRLQRTFQEEAQQHDLNFEVSYPESLPGIQGDFDMLEQALENVISNALKYTLPGGQVELVFSQEKEGLVTITVKDTGIGIPEACQDQVFSEFFRADNAKDIEEQGTGLGLAIVKDVVERHGGRIQVHSQEGQGTVIEIKLPVDCRSG